MPTRGLGSVARVLLVVRVWLPDRPGALGQVASRIGAVRGDVLGIEILETGAGRVIDELVVDLADDSHIDLLISEVGAVDGVSVEHVRAIDGDRVDPDLAALEVGADLAACGADDRLGVLCAGVARVADASWSVAVRDASIVESVGEIPAPTWLVAFLDGAQHLSELAGGADGLQAFDHPPSDIVWARLPRSGVAIAAGRSDRPVHERERTRVGLLARLADALIE